MAAAERMRVSTARVRVWSGGSASRMMLGGRHGISFRKSLSPTPADEQNVSQSIREARTSSWRAIAQIPYRSSHTTAPASRSSSWNGYGFVSDSSENGSTADTGAVFMSSPPLVENVGALLFVARAVTESDRPESPVLVEMPSVMIALKRVQANGRPQL